MQVQVIITKYFVLIFLALFLVTQIPLYWVEYPDIADFINHLARLHILQHLSESEALQQYYTLRHLKIGTNIAMEVIVPPLAKGMSLILALKLFTSFSMLLLTSGAVALGRVITGRFSYLLLGVLFFTHNLMFQLGLLNYLFGLGLAFWLLAAWIYTCDKFDLIRWIAFSLACILVYLSHLSALGVYAVCVLGYQLGREQLKMGCINKSVLKALILPLTQFVPVVMLHLLASVSTGIDAPASSEYPLLVHSFIWIISKFLILLTAPLISVSGYIMAQTIFGFLLVFALYIGFREGLLKLSVSVQWMAVLLLLCILMLPDAGFGSRFVSMRLVPALVLILWSGLQVVEGRALNSKWLLGLITAVVVLMSLETGREWVLRDDEYKNVRAALQRMPEGAKVATLQLDKPKNPDSISPHSGAFSVIDRSALLSNMFIWPFQPFWVAYNENYVPLVKKARLEEPIKPMLRYEDVKRDYDYLLIFGGTPIDRMQYAQNAETAFSSKSMRLIRTGLAHPVSSRKKLEK